VLDQQRLEAALDRDGDPLDLLRLALEPAADPVADPTDTGLQGAQQLTGADELLPPGEDLAAQEAAVGGRLGHVAPRLVVGPDHVVAEPSGHLDLGRVGDRHLLGPPGDRPDGPVEGLPDDRRAGGRVGGEPLEPGADLHDLGDRQQPGLVDGPLLHGEERRALEAALAEHLLQVRGDLVASAGWDPVEHDRDRRAALGGRPQEVPGHLVGVTRGRGDEEPEVCGRQQLGGEGAVADLDGVDVRGVEDRQSGRDGVDGDELERPGVAGGRRGAGELRQDARVVEPAGVGRVEREHR
jgi:hypothetical protein